jgi:hypothetical protein
MATTEDKKLIEKLLKKNRKWFERWMVFEDKIAADLTVVMRDLEVSKRNIVMRHVSRLALDENGVFLNSPDNTGVVLEMIRDVGKFNREMIEPGAPYTKWVTKNFEKSGLKGIAKALDTVKVADTGATWTSGYCARCLCATSQTHRVTLIRSGALLLIPARSKGCSTAPGVA